MSRPPEPCHLGGRAPCVQTLFCLVFAVLMGACAPDTSDSADPDWETVLSLQPPTWFEDGWSVWEVSADGRSALFGARFGQALYRLETGAEADATYTGGMDRVDGAVFLETDLLRLGTIGDESGWFLGTDEPGWTSLPADAINPRFSPDGTRVAYSRGTGGVGDGIYVGTPTRAQLYEVGSTVNAVGWSPDARYVFTTVAGEDGLSTLLRLDTETEEISTIAEGLDTPWRFNSIAAAPDGRSLFLSLGGATPPDPEDRHRPEANRDLDIYELDLETGALTPRVQSPGDDLYPVIAGEDLFWTHNDFQDDVVVLPIDGGESRVVVPDAQIPYWSHDGSQIAYTYGGWRVANWALNLDAGVVDVDSQARPTSGPEPIVVGYHEDFTPAWSPDGRWIAYHSHRSPTPVASYSGPGSTDDIYLRRPDLGMEAEIRLTDFGWEVGMADWSPDGTRLVFDSWERGGARGVSRPWIATIDPESGALVGVERLMLPDELVGTLLAGWSPAGDLIAAVERIDGPRQAMWLIRADGTGGRRSFEFEASTYGGVDWTPDGGSLVYGATTGGRMHLFSRSPDGGLAVQLTHGDFDHVQPQISPDGRWIAATRMRHTKEVRRSRITER